jgi:hypothetical protein
MTDEKKLIEEEKVIVNPKHTFYFILGIAFFLLSVYSMCVVVQKISGLKFTLYSERNDAIQSYLALPAFFASIAGILFIIDNLKLQRNTLLVQIDANKMQYNELKLQILESQKSNEHFKTQSDIMRIQQYDNTFFNLLNNQKSLLNNIVFKEYSKGEILVGSSALGYIVKKINAYLQLYKDSLYKEHFNSVEITRFNQICLYEKFEEISSVTNNIIHIIEYIIEKLDNSEFHHKTFYYNLTNDEKFVIGLVIHNNINVIAKLKYDYKEYYLINSNYTIRGEDIPNCNIVGLESNKLNDIVISDTELFKERIIEFTKFNFISSKVVKPIRLNANIRIEHIRNLGTLDSSPIKNNEETHILDTMTFDLYFVIKEYIFSYYNNNKFENSTSFNIYIKNLIYVFSDNNTEYEVLIGDVIMVLNVSNNLIEIKFTKNKFNDSDLKKLAY